MTLLQDGITAAGFAAAPTTGPPYRPSAYGLLATVPVTDNASLRLAPATFLSQAAPALTGESVTDPCTVWAKAPNIPEDWLTTAQFALYGYWTCTPVGYTLAEATSRAHDGYMAGEAAGLEKLLWAWMLAKAGTPTAATGSQVALATAELAIARQYGGEGTLHMDRSSAIMLGTHLERYGSTLRTVACYTPVVVGDGYGPIPGVPGETHIIATGPVTVTRGPLVDVSNPPIVDRSLNDLAALVERTYQVAIDLPAVVAVTATTP
jgi:hypothetical protein